MKNTLYVYLARNMDGSHRFRCSARISKGTFLAHLFLSQRDAHLRENARQNDGGDAASADRLARGVEGHQDVGNALQHLHLGSLHGKTGQVLRSSKSSRNDNRLGSKQGQRTTSKSDGFSCSMSFTFDRAILRYSNREDLPSGLDENVPLLLGGLSLMGMEEAETIQ